MAQVESDDRSTAFNNAGVRVLTMAERQRNHGIAQELFRGALESKFHSLRNSQQEQRDDEGNDDDGMMFLMLVQHQEDATQASELAVATAENHLLHIDSYLEDLEEVVPTPPPESAPHDIPSGSRIVRPMVVPVQSRGYELFVCVTPFSLPERHSQQPPMNNARPHTTVITAQRSSAIILFNLGMMHHCMNRRSRKAGSIYKIANALVSSEPEAPGTALDDVALISLRIAIINNLGVWSFENDNCPEVAIICMEQLNVMLEQQGQEPGSSSSDNGQNENGYEMLRQGVRSNILWILSPSHGGSPAA